MAAGTRRVLNLLLARKGEAVDREELLGLGVCRLRARIAELRFRGHCILCHEWREGSRPGFRGSAYVLVDKPALLKAAEFLAGSEPGEAEPACVAQLGKFVRTACSLLGTTLDALEKEARALAAGGAV